MDHYAVLGVDPDADQAAIERAYRERVKAVHPDRNDAPDADKQFRRVKKAREVLTDPEARARYDRRRERRKAASDPDLHTDRSYAGTGRTRAAENKGVDQGRWAKANPDEWVGKGGDHRRERGRRARRRRHRRHGARVGSGWEVGEAPGWYTATREPSRPEPSGLPDGDTVLLLLAAAYALVVALAAGPLGVPARLVVGLVTLLAVLFVLRVPEVALPTVGVVVTVVLPAVALLGLTALSVEAVVGGFAVAVPTAAVALFVRLR